MSIAQQYRTKLRTFLNQSGIDITVFAKEMGVSPPNIHRILKDKHRNLRSDTMDRIDESIKNFEKTLNRP
jgi:predicted transcriptional regulator